MDAIATDMLSAIKETLSGNWSKVEPIAKQFVHGRKNRLELLAESYIKGEITLQKLESRLEDEKTILEAELEALKVLSKAPAQKAANMAFDILTKAIKAAL